jgi:hypothetical protein
MSRPDPPDVPHEVGRLQQWFQAVVTHPDGVAAGAGSETARHLIALPPGELEKVVTRSKALTAAERLAIYANAYHTRLLECLGEVFPILKRALGEEVFNGFAFGYLQEYPSRSYTLNDLGRHFPRYLEETRPPAGTMRDDADDGVTAEESIGLGDDWPDFLIDLARLEWAIYEVFDGEGVEGRPLLQTDQLLDISQEKLPGVRLATVPCLRLLATRFAVNDYYTAVRKAGDDEVPGIPAAADTFVALTRRNYVVRRYNLSRSEFEILSALQRGETLERAIEVAAAAGETDMERLAVQLQQWFRHWTAEGFFAAIKPA